MNRYKFFKTGENNRNIHVLGRCFYPSNFSNEWFKKLIIRLIANHRFKDFVQLELPVVMKSEEKKSSDYFSTEKEVLIIFIWRENPVWSGSAEINWLWNRKDNPANEVIRKMISDK